MPSYKESGSYIRGSMVPTRAMHYHTSGECGWVSVRHTYSCKKTTSQSLHKKGSLILSPRIVSTQPMKESRAWPLSITICSRSGGAACIQCVVRNSWDTRGNGRWEHPTTSQELFPSYSIKAANWTNNIRCQCGPSVSHRQINLATCKVVHMQVFTLSVFISRPIFGKLPNMGKNSDWIDGQLNVFSCTQVAFGICYSTRYELYSYSGPRRVEWRVQTMPSAVKRCDWDFYDPSLSLDIGSERGLDVIDKTN